MIFLGQQKPCEIFPFLLFTNHNLGETVGKCPTGMQLACEGKIESATSN